MPERVPDLQEFVSFLDRMIVEARRLGDVERCDALLEKRAQPELQLAFLEQVLNE